MANRGCVLLERKRLCCLCARPDENFCRALKKYLISLEKQGYIECWHSGMTSAGEDRIQATIRRLERADVIILILSVDLLVLLDEHPMLGTIIERQRQNEIRMIPVLVRRADYSCLSLPFAGLQVLPRDGRPVKLWRDRDSAWAEVVGEIRTITAAPPSMAAFA